MNVYVVRAFVKLRELLASNKDLARKLAALERSLVALDLKTRRQFKEVYEAIRALMNPPQPKRRSIGFTADLGENRYWISVDAASRLCHYAAKTIGCLTTLLST